MSLSNRRSSVNQLVYKIEWKRLLAADTLIESNEIARWKKCEVSPMQKFIWSSNVQDSSRAPIRYKTPVNLRMDPKSYISAF